MAKGNPRARHLSHMINRSLYQDAKRALLRLIIPVAICTCLPRHAIEACVHMFYMCLSSINVSNADGSRSTLGVQVPRYSVLTD